MAAANAIAANSFADQAQPLGRTLSTIIIFGDQYDGGDELYDAKITVVQVVRGEKAWEMLKAVSTSNPPPKASSEYLLARVRFEFSARTSPSHYNYTIDETQFTAMKADGTAYAVPSIAEQPMPDLQGTLKPGNSVEGWITFAVPRSDRQPLMLFRADVGSVIHEGGGSLFKLYVSSQAAGRPSRPNKTRTSLQPRD
ncbi:MAG TPA: DUF4352 domain-containing protein [Candidatus Acidoferrales bacterium]|nr:DUF4352 domain-containing protein [Candidatus Acidoferrales bacterium]